MRFSRLSIIAIAILGTPALFSQYGPEQNIPQEGPRAVEVLDMDGDGDNDVVIMARMGVQVYYNTDGQGTLSTGVMASPNNSVGHASDLDGDDHPDVIGSSDLDGGIQWNHNYGTFGFGPSVTIDPVLTADMINTGDLDGDGDNDLIAAFDNNTLMWSENTDGLGGFGAFQMITYATDVTHLEAYDMDADGDVDVNWSTAITDQAFWADNTDGLGTLDAPLLLSSEGRGTHEDIDGDGRMDLALISTVGDVAVWQRRDLEFTAYGTAHPVDPSIDAPGAILAADLDGDGDRDIAITSIATAEVMWYENIDGMGAFGPRQVIGTNVQDAEFLAAGDLDHDGDLELFTGSGPQQRIVRYDNMANADGIISGRVFNDMDNNGLFSGTDHGLYNVRVEIPGVGHTFTNHGGMYWFAAVPGSYSVEVPAVDGWNFSTAPVMSVTLAAGGSQDHDVGLHAATIIHGLNAGLINAPTRCGTDIMYWINVSNIGNQVDEVRLSLDLESLSGFVSSTPAPATDNGSTQTWVFDDVQPTHHRQIALVVELPDASHMGEILHDALNAQAWNGGSMVLQVPVANDPELLCAYDPNDKQVFPAGDGQLHLTPMDQTLTYTIRFQNTGLIAAEDVFILDQLDADLDPQTVQMINASHAVHALVGPDGAITFAFEGIQLPDSASDPEGSQGFVRFSVHALPGLPNLTPVENHAEIVFDANPAIVTNTVLNTLVNDATGLGDPFVNADASMSVAPNPALDMATVYLGDGLQGRVELIVIDDAGRVVQRVIRNSNTVVLERGGLPDGIYLLRAVDQSGREALTRLVWAR